MDVARILLASSIMLLAALLAEPLAARLRLPQGALLALGGFLGSEALVRQGIDTGLRWYHFHDLILFAFLPALVFEAALRFEPSRLRAQLLPILVLSIPVVLLSTLILAALLYLGIGHARGFPWAAALVAGALLAATDPVGILGLFKEATRFKELAVLLEGESLFNDAASIVLFHLLVGYALFGAGTGIGNVLLGFVWMLAGGIAVGLGVGSACAILLGRFASPRHLGLVTFLGAYFAFLLAEKGGTSGVVAVLAAGMLIGRWLKRCPPEGRAFVEHLWGFNAYMAEALIFVLMGVTITVEMFTGRWAAMLLGIAAAIGARAAAIFSLFPLFSRLSWEGQGLLVWGGLRGGVTLALALSLPVELEGWWTIQSIAYGVVLFGLFVQAPSFSCLARRALAGSGRNPGGP